MLAAKHPLRHSRIAANQAMKMHKSKNNQLAALVDAIFGEPATECTKEENPE